MNKKLVLSFVFIIAFLLTACDGNDLIIHPDANKVNMIQSENSLSPTLMPDVSLKWKVLYKTYLNALYETKKPSDDLRFYLRDIDNDGIPELITTKNGPNVTVHTYNNELIKVGNENYGTATTRLFFSNNSLYPGIFDRHFGGGLERYGYLYIKNNKLIYEELWNIDYSNINKTERKRIEELSKDKKLVKVSKKTYKENNDVPWQKLQPNNFNKSIDDFVLNDN